MPHIGVHGSRLHYRLDGPADASTVVLSNSLGCNLDMWSEQLPVLARRYRVLRYDVRGHGASDVPPGPYTIADLGHDALRLLDELHIERAHFCGVSLGGMLGIWLAVNAPGRLDSIVLANTSAKLGPASVWNDRMAAVSLGGTAAVANGVVSRWFTESFRASSPEAVDRFRQMLLNTPTAGYIACCAAIRDMDQIPTLGSVSCRSLVIVGEHDPSTPPQHGEAIAAGVPGATLARLPAAHLSNVETSQGFNALLEGFLQ